MKQVSRKIYIFGTIIVAMLLVGSIRHQAIYSWGVNAYYRNFHPMDYKAAVKTSELLREHDYGYTVGEEEANRVVIMGQGGQYRI